MWRVFNGRVAGGIALLLHSCVRDSDSAGIRIGKHRQGSLNRGVNSFPDAFANLPIVVEDVIEPFGHLAFAVWHAGNGVPLSGAVRAVRDMPDRRSHVLESSRRLSYPLGMEI
jgi:hypothetical protein